jgi:septal ring factor EnvC (AmiA/AmiB activator)
MTHDELERAIEFLLTQQAKSNSETETLRASVTELTADVGQLTAEMREAFNNLIVANEVTRDLANRIGELAVNNSHRLTRVERELKLE